MRRTSRARAAPREGLLWRLSVLRRRPSSEEVKRRRCDVEQCRKLARLQAGGGVKGGGDEQVVEGAQWVWGGRRRRGCGG